MIHYLCVNFYANFDIILALFNVYGKEDKNEKPTSINNNQGWLFSRLGNKPQQLFKN